MVTTHTQPQRKLGKLPAVHDKRTLLLAKYMSPERERSLRTPPLSVRWSRKTDQYWPMFANDTVGDCTCATAGHLIQAWTANAQAEEFEPATKDVLAMYYAISGYIPGRPETDVGAACLDVLRYWRKKGCGGHKIGAFAAVSPRSKQDVRDAIWLFGGAYVGLQLPLSAQDQTTWSVPRGGAQGAGEPGTWGGHAVPLIDYDPRGLWCVTWGGLKRLTWSFLATYADEAYAIISEDFLTGGKAPNGFDAATLQADLSRL